jgi:hypothetical protein
MLLFIPKCRTHFLKKHFDPYLQKRLRIFTTCMLRHTLEEVVELAREVEDDMTSGRYKTKRKH